MRQTLQILFIVLFFAGCAYHRNFAKVDFDGTFRVTSISGAPYTRVTTGSILQVGDLINISQTESQVIVAHPTGQKILDLQKKSTHMRGNALIYKPPGAGPSLFLGPSVSKQYDRLTLHDDQLTIESKDFESGLMFGFIPWKEGGSTTVILRKE